MDDTDYNVLCDEAVAALRAVMRVDAAKIRSTVSYVHSVGHILNPTAYRDGTQSLDDQSTIAAAILAAQREVLASERLTTLLNVADQLEGREPWPCQVSEAPDA